MTDVALRFPRLSNHSLLAIAIAALGPGIGSQAAAADAACGWLDPQAAAKFSAIAVDCVAPASVMAVENPGDTAADPADSPAAPVASPPESVSVPFGNFSRRMRVRPVVFSGFVPPRPAGLIAAVAARHRIDPLLLGAIVARESGGRAGAVSAKGAIGLMQVMPATGRALGVADPARLRDPATSLIAGATYLKQLQAQFGNDLALTLAAYNAGPGAVARHHGVPPYAETRAYVSAILARYRAARAAGVGTGAARGAGR